MVGAGPSQRATFLVREGFELSRRNQVGAGVAGVAHVRARAGGIAPTRCTGEWCMRPYTPAQLGAAGCGRGVRSVQASFVGEGACLLRQQARWRSDSTMRARACARKRALHQHTFGAADRRQVGWGGRVPAGDVSRNWCMLVASREWTSERGFSSCV